MADQDGCPAAARGRRAPVTALRPARMAPLALVSAVRTRAPDMAARPGRRPVRRRRRGREPDAYLGTRRAELDLDRGRGQLPAGRAPPFGPDDHHYAGERLLPRRAA